MPVLPQANSDKRVEEAKLQADLPNHTSLPLNSARVALRLLDLAITEYDGLPSHLQSLQPTDIHFQSLQGKENGCEVEIKVQESC